MVVAGTPNVFVVRGQGVGGVLVDLDAVQTVLENRVDMPVGAGSDSERALASDFETLGTVAFAQPQDAEARAVAHLRVRPVVQNRGRQRPGVRSDVLGPVHDARWSPLRVGSMRLGHVRTDRGVLTDPRASPMARDPLSLVQDLDAHRRGADFDLFFAKRVRHRVVVALVFDVVVDIDACLFPVPEHESLRRQRPERLLLEALEELEAADAPELLHRPVVELL